MFLCSALGATSLQAFKVPAAPKRAAAGLGGFQVAQGAFLPKELAAWSASTSGPSGMGSCSMKLVQKKHFAK